MNKYIVAYWNDPTGELLQEEVEAESKFKALASYLQYPTDATQTLASLEAYCANNNQMVTATRVGSFHKKPDTPNWPYPSNQLQIQ